MRIVSFSEAQDQLKNLLDRTVTEADCILISREDAEDVVVMSLDYYNSLFEALQLLKSPRNIAHLAKSIDQYRASKT